MTTYEKAFQEKMEEFLEHGSLDLLNTAIQMIEEIEQPETLQDKGVNIFRKKKLQLMLDFFNAIDEKRDPKFDFDDKPLMSIPPPSETGLPAGISSEEYMSPHLKEQYDEDVRKNIEKRRNYEYQLGLKKSDQVMQTEFQSHIEIFYSRKITDLLEIEKYIDKNITLRNRQASLKALYLNL